MNKELIKKRFSRQLANYNANASIQQQMAEKLLENISTEHCYNSVLEIGCGTGLLTEIAVNNIQHKHYIALDIVAECQNYIKKINPQIEFVNADIETYINTCEEFDLIISNASLQWVDDMPALVKKILSKLSSNGTLIFSTFGKENFREIFYILGKTLPYYSKNELLEEFKDYSPVINEEIKIMRFENPKEVLKHIQKTGVNALSSNIWTKKDLINFEKMYNSLCADRATLTYNPMYVTLNK